ncbi:MAG TPA: metal ABC transporter substrate-binding protein [Chloroflexota bacterium]|nr:metal ABC transporter substrate-binding protein [Chloroflexota bacterium]
MMYRLLLTACSALLLATACGGTVAAPKPIGPQLGWSDELPANGKLNVATTVAPISSIVRNVGGDRINLHGIIPDGTDSHTFQPAPGDAKVLAKADIVVLNGLHLETPTEKLARANLKSGAGIYMLGDSAVSAKEWIFDFSFPSENGDPNPHLWMNPQYALKYAELTRDWLSERDPKNRHYFGENEQQYASKLGQVDKAIEIAVNSIPPRNRKLLTYHDSFAYFGRRYSIEPIGAIQPSDFAQPSPQEVGQLIQQIKAEKVPAIFGSEVFPSKVLEQIARETGAQFVDKLRDDEPPGPPNSPTHTYLGLMLEDVSVMAQALGGNADSLKGIDPADSFVRST